MKKNIDILALEMHGTGTVPIVSAHLRCVYRVVGVQYSAEMNLLTQRCTASSVSIQ